VGSFLGGGSGFRSSGRRQNSGFLLWDLEVTSLRIKGRPVLSGHRGPPTGHLRHWIGCKPVVTMADGESALPGGEQSLGKLRLMGWIMAEECKWKFVCLLHGLVLRVIRVTGIWREFEESPYRNFSLRSGSQTCPGARVWRHHSQTMCITSNRNTVTNIWWNSNCVD